MHRAFVPAIAGVLVLAQGLASGCSSSDSETVPRSNTGGSAGTASTGGTGGSGGSGGSALTCDECAQQSCATSVAACKADAGCAAWLTCLQACTDAACAQSCADQHPEGATTEAPVAACLCQSCVQSCTAFDACKVCIDDQPLPVMMTPPANLSETGLYADIATNTVASYAEEFHPQYPLWSDGATKVRHIYLPKCAQVDTSDMDHWKFPVGTRLWKEFTVNNVRVETRMIHRFGPGSTDWLFAAYQWNNADQSDAVLVPMGVDDANGTDHDIPSETQCHQCHDKLPERVLGFGAIQLSHSESGLTIGSLSAAGRLTVPKPDGFTVPGDGVAQGALGYMHANCGTCHNATGVAFITMHLRLLVANMTVEDTDAYKTAVGVPTDNFQCGFMPCLRIQPGDATASAVVIRMASRVAGTAMPPLATEYVDDTGVAAVSDWINSLPP